MLPFLLALSSAWATPDPAPEAAPSPAEEAPEVFDTIGYYHPGPLAAASETFRSSQEVAGAAFENAQSATRRYSKAIAEYELGLDVLGTHARDDMREHFDGLFTTFRGQAATLNQFATGQMDQFNQIFTDALGRALVHYPLAVECLVKAPRGPRMGPRLSAPAEEAECEGEDLNGTLAATMDADAELSAGVEALITAEWPSYDLPEEPQPALDDGTVYIYLSDVLLASLSTPLARIARDDEEARLPIGAALEQPNPDIEALRTQADAISAATRAARAELAAPVLDVIFKALARSAKKGQPMTLCAQPEAFGGCQGTPATAEQLEAIVGWGAYQKAVKKAQ